MVNWRRFVLLAFIALALPATTSAQAAEDTRPAATTIYGDTGLWFVPTAEILPHRAWSASAYRVEYDREQGFTDIGHFLATVGVGVGDRAEVFGSVRLVTRIDRDIRPLFTANESVGGLVQDYPFVNSGWIGNEFGDIYLGAKINLLSEHRQHPVALAVRPMVKLPSGDEEQGAGTGKAHFQIDVIVSKDVRELVELTGSAGYLLRGDPSNIDLSNSFTWGVGAGFPTRGPIRLFTEIHGEVHADDRRFASAFVDARMMAWLLEQVPGMGFEVLGGRLMVFRPRVTTSVDDVSRALELFEGLTERVPRVVPSLFPGVPPRPDRRTERPRP